MGSVRCDRASSRTGSRPHATRRATRWRYGSVPRVPPTPLLPRARRNRSSRRARRSHSRTRPAAASPAMRAPSSRTHRGAESRQPSASRASRARAVPLHDRDASTARADDHFHTDRRRVRALRQEAIPRATRRAPSAEARRARGAGADRTRSAHARPADTPGEALRARPVLPTRHPERAAGDPHRGSRSSRHWRDCRGERTPLRWRSRPGPSRRAVAGTARPPGLAGAQAPAGRRRS